MNASATPDAWSRSRAVRIDQACTRFEAAWKAGQRPKIGDYLGEVPQAERSSLFCELLVVELQWRLARQEQPARD